MYMFYTFKCNASSSCNVKLHPHVIQWRGDFPSCCVVHATRFLSAIPPPPHPFRWFFCQWYFSVWRVPVPFLLCGGLHGPGILQAPNLHLAMRLWMKKASQKFRASTRIETKTSALPTEPWNHPRRYTFSDIPLPTQSLTLPFFVSSRNSFSPHPVLRDDPK